jgi:hypothetical protein
VDENSSANLKLRFDVGQIAAIVGVGSALFVFIGAVFTWSFAHGLLEVLGFPSQVVSLKTAVDAFPSVAVDAVGGSFGFLVIGFVAGPVRKAYLKTEIPKKNRATSKRILTSGEIRGLVCFGALLFAFIPLTITLGKDTRSVVFSALLFVAYIVATSFIGISYYLYAGNSFARYFITGMFSALALLSGTSFMFQHGRDVGAKLAERSDLNYLEFTGRGMSSIDASDFSLVALTTKEKLALSSGGETDGKTFTYLPKGAENFIRLIIQDENNYYVIERYGGTKTSMAIRKEIVSQIVFMNPQ